MCKDKKGRGACLAAFRGGNLPGNGWLAIQATSVGLYPDCEKAAVEDRAFYEKVKAGYDLIYRPAETKFMKLVKETGAPAYNGLKMLYIRAWRLLNFGTE